MEKRKQLKPEVLVPRLGEHLVERGLITAADLQNALDHQAAYRDANSAPPLLGSILIELGLIDQSSLDEAITEQIIQLRNALQDANLQLEKRVQQRTAELERALNKLAELNQLKANFISNISHELRTPLTHLKGYLELLLSQDLGPLSQSQDQALHIMQRSTERLEHLIEDLILFSTAERSTIALDVHPVNLANLGLAIINQSITKANEHQVTLHLNLAPSLPFVKADADKIAWVISQLIDNGIKFTSAGGKVTLRAEQIDQFVTVSVEDTGLGISPDKFEEIFEPFHQLDGSSTRRFGGTGLGLALVRKILDSHGSKIRVHSQPGLGSKFEFYLRTAEKQPKRD
jgi:signal transduction histidine kinase